MQITLHRPQAPEPWNLIKTNWLIAVVTKFVVFFIIASLAAIAWRWSRLPPLVPLWYSRPWGTDQMAPPVWLFILPLGSLVLYFVNLVIAIYLTADYLIFTQMLFLSSFLVSCLSFITLIKILFLVT